MRASSSRTVSDWTGSLPRRVAAVEDVLVESSWKILKKLKIVLKRRTHIKNGKSKLEKLINEGRINAGVLSI